MGTTTSATDRSGLAPPSPREPPEAVRAPLGWLLVPLIPGYLLASFFDFPAPGMLVLAGLVLVALSLRCRREVAWMCALLPAVMILAWAWADLRRSELPEPWQELPPREVEGDATVLRWFSGKTYPDRQYALVEWTSVPRLTPELLGARVFCSLPFDGETPAVRLGGTYRLRGVISPLEQPARDDFTRYLESEGAWFRLRQGSVEGIVQPPPAWRQFLEQQHERWKAALTAAPPERQREARLLAAMILGERSFLSPEQEEVFLLSGTMHLFAISGLHVMIVALTLQQGLQFLPLPARARFALVLVLLFLYVAVTGFSPSAMRAFSMVAFYWAAGLLGRPPRPLPAVLGSAVVVLVVDPAQLFSAGFQLSYSVVLSILLLGLPLGRTVLRHWPLYPYVLPEDRRWWQRGVTALRQRSVESLCISLAATLGSAPLIILHFELWTPGAIVLNAFLVPLASLAVAFGVLIIVLSAVALPAAAGFFAHGAWLVLLTMQGIVDQGSRLPGMYDHRAWLHPAIAFGVLGLFLLSLLALSEAAAGGRLRPRTRHLVPILVVTVGLYLASTPMPALP